MTNRTTREIHLAKRPDGMPDAACFKLVEREIPALKDGQALVRNAYMSVDPYMRGRMIERESYVPPFQIGEALSGGAVGQVIESKNAKFPVGTFVSHMAGWREHAVIDDRAGAGAVDPKLVPIQAYLGAFGMPGLTAYAGLLRVGAFKDGESVFVSAASGAVGAIVCQIAKARGARVVGSAGSDEKCRWLTEVAGIDAAINYKTAGDLTAALKTHFPKGVDVYFENVGGAHLIAALNSMRVHGRIVLCGMIEQYNATAPQPGPWNLIMAIPQRLRLEGFVVSDHFDMLGDFLRDMAAWRNAGKMKWEETILEGLEKAPEAFLGLFSGANFGKMLVRVGPDSAV